MSSSDYTNLRRIRHVYYPTLNTCNTNHTHAAQPVYTVPTTNQCYVTPHTHNNCNTVATTSNHCNCANTVATTSNHCNCANTVATTSNHCNCANTVATNHCNCACNQPQLCAPAHSHALTTTNCCQDIVSVPDMCNTHLPDKTTMSMSVREYLLTPTFFGSTTFTIDCNLAFSKGMKVICTQDLSSNNYFEGVVFNYYAPTGEITVYQLAKVNGSFANPSKYIVSLIPAFQEIDLLRTRMEQVYFKVFGIDISGPTAPATGGGGTTTPTVDVTTEDTQLKGMFNYFFSEDISTDSSYAATETYLNTKINELYTYFFDINLTTNTTFNPNNNGIALDTLANKVQQLNLYFFGNKDVTTYTS